MIPNDPLQNILYIDLSRNRFRVEPRPDLFEKHLGGTGVAIELLHETCPAGVDPYAPEAPIILATGPLVGLLPLASKAVAMFKSPHTGNLGESHAGGRTAVAIREAGYGAIVIQGASSLPLYLVISDGSVRFRDATTLWGMRHANTAARVIREHESGAGVRTIMRIGRAGENLVSYACVKTETYRTFGRLGLGAVFGSKKLKAIVVAGKHSLPVTDRRAYRRVYDQIYQAAIASPLMKKYHDLGTSSNVLPLNAIGGLPVRNLQAACLEDATRISGEGLAEGYLGRRLACAHCPVGCIHIAALREPYANEPYFYKTTMISYDYEPLYALGTMLGIADPADFLRLLDVVESWGLDAMSTGVVLAWATEALERGLISTQETSGLPLSWGDAATYILAVRNIVEQPNDFYRALARGVEYASSVYGGQEFALAFGGNEMPGYHTGPAAHLGWLLGLRHSHLDNAGYSIDQKPTDPPPTPEALVDALMKEEQWRQILSSLVICFFARGIYTPEIVQAALEVAGLPRDAAALEQIGESIYRRKYAFKVREGFSIEHLRIPQRIYETPSSLGMLDEEFMRRALVHAKKRLEG